MSDKKIEIKDLKPADILLFSGVEGDFISEAIMFLTDSNVSHAAMSYKESNTIVDAVPPAVRTASAEEKFKGRTIYVNRFDGNKEPLTPVLAAAETYLKEKTPYALYNLLFVGLILIYKKFSTPGLDQKILIEIFKKLAAALIDYTNKEEHPGKSPMVCSQFVYQCYEDAGQSYRLKIKNGTLVGRSLLDEGEMWSLLDHVLFETKTNRAADFTEFLAGPEVAELGAITSKSEADLAKELLDSLKAPKAAATTEKVGNELIAAVYQFAEAYYSMRSGTKTDLKALSSANEKGLAPDALNFLKSEEAYFVTPADLLDKCKNAERIGFIKEGS